jgi:ParB family transcriptional regulator, chromosome partitioning protein
MSDVARKPALGRGLSALFGETGTSAGTAVAAATGDSAPRGGARTLPIEYLRPGKYQPRQQFDEEAIAGLAQSIRERGILQPILVRKIDASPNSYEIIAGERRWRAAQKAGLHEVPVVIRTFTDSEALEVAILENVQRQDLNVLEESEGYRRLMTEFSYTQEALAKVLGKSRSHIANTMRLINLPESVQVMVRAGLLTAGHARALLTVSDPEKAAQEVVNQSLSVRQTEQLANMKRGTAPTRRPRAQSSDAAPVTADTLALEKEIEGWLGLSAKLTQIGSGGTLMISYQTLDQLEDLLRRLSATPKPTSV